VLLLDSGRDNDAAREHFVKSCDGGMASACRILERFRRAK
jgi:hypothetical protein